MAEVKGVLTIFFSPARIAAGKRLLEMATKSEDDDLFPALSSVMLAVALEDAVMSAIADRCANATALGISRHVYSSIRYSSLRQRMSALAEIVGQGFFSSPRTRRHGEALHYLISLRNRLLHIDEVVHEFNEGSENVLLLDNVLQLSVKLPQDPWTQVTKEEARSSVEAVECYMIEVVNPLGDMSNYWPSKI